MVELAELKHICCFLPRVLQLLKLGYLEGKLHFSIMPSGLPVVLWGHTLTTGP